MPRDRWVPCRTLNQTPPPSAYLPPSPRPSPALPRRTSRVSSPFEPSSAIPPTITRATSNNKCIARQDHIKVIYSGSLFSRLVWCLHRSFSSFPFAIFLLSSLLLIFFLLGRLARHTVNQRVLILMLLQPVSYFVFFSTLCFYQSFFSCSFCLHLVFLSIIVLISTAFCSRAGHLRLQASLFFYFCPVLLVFFTGS